MRWLSSEVVGHGLWWIAAAAAMVSALGTLEQVQLQHQMAARLTQIHGTLQNAKSETHTLNSQLAVLKLIAQSSQGLEHSVGTTQTTSSNITAELKKLDGIVGGIQTHVTNITNHTNLAGQQITVGNQFGIAVTTNLKHSGTASQSVIYTLQEMVALQQQINLSLEKLNHKLP